MKKNSWDKVKETMKKALEFLKQNLFITVLVAFVLVTLSVILVATLAMKEYIIPVCVLVIMEAGMAALLKKSEVWVHGVVIALQLLGGFLIHRFPLTALCVVVYVVGAIALMLLHKEEKPKAKFNSKVKTK